MEQLVVKTWFVTKLEESGVSPCYTSIAGRKGHVLMTIDAKIGETEKAIKVSFNNKETWMPKSVIESYEKTVSTPVKNITTSEDFKSDITIKQILGLYDNYDELEFMICDLETNLEYPFRSFERKQLIEHFGGREVGAFTINTKKSVPVFEIYLGIR